MGGRHESLSPRRDLAADGLGAVLVELGATTVRGHYQLDSLYDDPDAYGTWVREVRPLVEALTREPLGVVA